MDNYIRWNAINWFTIGIIALVTFAAYGFIGQLVQTALGKGPSS